MGAVQPCELRDRLRVVVDPQVDEDVAHRGVAAVALHDEQRGGLLAAAVAARRLRGGEALEQPLRERPARRRGEGRRERSDGLLADEDVALRGEARAGLPAGPVEALAAREGGAAAGRVDDAELAVLASLVGLGERLDRLGGARAVAQEREPVRPVAWVRVRLGRDGADTRLGPRHHRADREELRLRGDAPVARLEVAGRDRVGRDDPVSHTSARSGRARAGCGR